jgi:hypothetical protein
MREAGRRVLMAGMMASLLASAGPVWAARQAGQEGYPAYPEETATPTPTPSEWEGLEPEPAPTPEDPTRTAGGALTLFMASRNYRSLRELKGVMTPALVHRFEYNSAPFNGKRGIRLAAFDFTESDLRPVRTTKEGAPTIYQATVRSLWENQGEAVERRTESIRIAQQEDGLWRVGVLEQVKSENLLFRDAVPGITNLRLLLRAWARRDLGDAKAQMSASFLKPYEGHDDALRAVFVGDNDPRHVAFEILDLQPLPSGGMVVHVRLYDASPDRPSSLEGRERTLRFGRVGARYVLDAWE